MNTLHRVLQSDDEGAVRLELSVSSRRSPVEVVVTWQELQERGPWPEGWLERTFGSIDDDTFERPEQGRPAPEFHQPARPRG
jgi:hypothetical protein